MEQLATVVREWTGAALDLLFPPCCLVCGEVGGGARPSLCDACWGSIVRLAPPWCVVCGRPFSAFDGPRAGIDRPDGLVDVCGACRRRRPKFTYARSAALYEGAMREALHAFKFSGKTALAGPLGDLLVEACGAGLPLPPDLVVPVPLHRARERERGFNQAALLARRVARGLDVPFGGRVVRRVRPTRAQADLSGAERRKNVRGAFAARAGAAPCGRHVLLIDDVLTTGTTVSECARVLIDEGALTVGVLTVARVAETAI